MPCQPAINTTIDPPKDLGSHLQEVYGRLYSAYGPQGWWPGHGPIDVVLGAILTQSAAWPNVEKALNNLKAAGCFSLEAIQRMSQDELAAIIRPSGYFNAKARKLKAFAAYIHDFNNLGSNSGGFNSGDLTAFLSQDLEPLRSQLLSIHGIGPETADDIVLYAAGKPSFVIDAYTRRILSRMGVLPDVATNRYATFQDLFHHNLPLDAEMFNEYHALLDRHAKEACSKTPRCAGCCLLDQCSTGRSLTSAS